MNNRIKISIGQDGASRSISPMLASNIIFFEMKKNFLGPILKYVHFQMFTTSFISIEMYNCQHYLDNKLVQL